MVVALSMVVQSVVRFIQPAVVQYREALPVAMVGLLVNLACIKLLGHGHDDHQDHGDDHGDEENGHDHESSDSDHNHRAALMHVVADALTSVLAIVSLALGAAFDWQFLDPLMGLIGGAVVMKWGVGLCRAAGRQLLDATTSDPLERRIRSLLESIDDVRVTDLHCWEVGPGRRACIATVITSSPRDVEQYRRSVLSACPVAHLTIEVHRCLGGHPDLAPATSALSPG